MTDEERETAARIIGTILLLSVGFAAIYPLAWMLHAAYRLALAGWHA